MQIDEINAICRRLILPVFSKMNPFHPKIFGSFVNGEEFKDLFIYYTSLPSLSIYHLVSVYDIAGRFFRWESSW